MLKGLKEKGKIAIFLLFVSFFLIILITSRWNDEYSSIIGYGIKTEKTHSRKEPLMPLSISCPAKNISEQQTCSYTTKLSPNKNKTHGSAHIQSPTCPDFFRYIHEDLKPWKSTGITEEMVQEAKHFANFRLVIYEGRAYVEKYKSSFQSRDVFTLWGIIQLLNRYPGQIPDLDLMFECDDWPLVKAADYRSGPAPPLFRYCKDDTTVEIVFPDWSFWGWPEINVKPWTSLMEDIKTEKAKTGWADREPYAYWKGAVGKNKNRQNLLTCNVSNEHEWNARIFDLNWEKAGFKNTNLAKECTYRYKIYIGGNSWSVSEKYILACDSPAFVVSNRYVDFFTRGLIPGKHYWPIRNDQKCKSIKYAVNWGNKHTKEAMKMGKAGSLFTQQELGMGNVYQYMLHLLTQYAKLLKYKPTIPKNAHEICLESLACSRTGTMKSFMLETMAEQIYDSEACKLPPPFDSKELEEISRRNEKFVKEIKRKEDEWNDTELT